MNTYCQCHNMLSYWSDFYIGVTIQWYRMGAHMVTVLECSRVSSCVPCDKY